MRERSRRLPRPVSERLRLVLTTHTFLPTVGGAELGVHELAVRLGRRHDVVVLARNFPKDKHGVLLTSS